MAHIIKEEKAEVMAEYAIFIILSPFGDKRFFISKTKQERLFKTYSEHYNLRVKKTRGLFEQAKKENMLPPMFLLDAMKMTPREAFRRMVAWTKYFMAHGYVQVQEDVLTKYAQDLTEETASYYGRIQEEQIEDVLLPEGGLFPNYGARTKRSKKKENSVISIYPDAEEYIQIQKAAEENDLSMAAYCKSMVLNGRVIQADLSFIGQYLDEFTSSKKLLRQILYSIYTTGNYYPADLKNIQSCIDHLTNIQKNVCKDIEKMIQTLRE